MVQVLMPFGPSVPYTGEMPPMNPEDSLRVFQTGPLLWVSLPKDVNADLIKNVMGTSYDGRMKMWAVQTAYAGALAAVLYRDANVRENHWPPVTDSEYFQQAIDVITDMYTVADAARVGELAEDIPSFLEHNGTMPRLYQYEAARYLSTIGKAILALPLGAGKGCSVITGLKLLREKPTPPFRGAVVICPASLKELVWRREVTKFSDMRPLVIEGPPDVRRELYETPADVYILNPELLYRDYKSIQKLVDKTSVLIVDEASILKNRLSATSKAVGKLAERKHYFWPMTGTPLMNSPLELYALVAMVDPHLFKNEEQFKYRHIPRTKDGIWLTARVQHVEELVEKVAPVMFARTPASLRAELPETSTVVEPVELTESMREMYDEIRSGAILGLMRYQTAAPSDRFLIISSALAALTRLKQVCVGVHTDDNPKLDRLLAMMDTDLLTDKVLIFSQYETVVNKIKDALYGNGIEVATLSGSMKPKDRQAAVDRFQNDASCRVFAMTTAGGMGLNLTRTTAVVFFDLLWNPQMMHQITGRAVRLGNSAARVRIISLLATKTIEDVIIKRLEVKSSTFNAIMHNEEITPDSDDNTMFHELLAILKSAG